MRKPTFETFITTYVKRLSLMNTVSMKKLANEIAVNPRIKEILYLYSYTMNNTNYLYKFLSPAEQGEFQQFLVLFDECKKVEEFLSKKSMQSYTVDDSLYPYVKIYKSYLSVRDKIKHENKTKQNMRVQMLEMKMKLRISDYRMCKIVSANHGNLHAFLYQNLDNRLSYEKCSKLYRYMLNQVKN